MSKRTEIDELKRRVTELENQLNPEAYELWVQLYDGERHALSPKVSVIAKATPIGWHASQGFTVRAGTMIEGVAVFERQHDDIPFIVADLKPAFYHNAGVYTLTLGYEFD